MAVETFKTQLETEYWSTLGFNWVKDFNLTDEGLEFSFRLPVPADPQKRTQFERQLAPLVGFSQEDAPTRFEWRDNVLLIKT